MRIAICEDDVMESETIFNFVKEHGEKNCLQVHVKRFKTGEALLGELSQTDFSIIFLDIYLPGISGVETARKIRERGHCCTIVFITTSTDHALDGYDVSAVSYIVKPIDQKKMEKAFAMCQKEFAEASRFIEVMADYRNIRIPLNKILYIEVYDKAALIHLETSVIKTYMPLNKIEKEIGGSPFWRCHRCFLVNMNYVKGITKQDFIMNNGNSVPIRKNGRGEVKLALANFMCGKYQLAT